MKNFLLSIFCCLMAFVSVQADEVTYTVTSSNAVSVTGTAPASSSVTYTSTYGTKCQLTKGNSMTLTLKGFSGHKITDITMSMKSNKSGGAGNFSMKAGSTTLSSIATDKFNTSSWAGKWSTSYIDITPAISVSDYTIGEEDVVITIAATENSLYCQSFTITYEQVGGVVLPELSDLVISPESCEFNNSIFVTITSEENAKIYYTTDGTDPTEKSELYSEPFEITETTTVKAVAVKEGYKKSSITEAKYTKVTIIEGGITDTLDREFTDVSSGTTSYADWSGKTATSSAVYAGNSAGGNDAIQLRTTNSNSGIVTTKSGGKVKKIYIDWNSNTDAARELWVYGKNTAYTSPADLYDSSTDGDKLAEILCGTNEFVIDGDYKYIGLRSGSGAMYLNSIEITWVEDATPETPTLTAGGNFVGSKKVEISCATEGAAIYYTTDGSEPTEDSEQYSEPFEITETTTVKAIAVNKVVASNVATADYTRVAATPEIVFEGDASAIDGEVVVSIKTENNAVAYYTLNGANPDASSTIYEKPITIKANATLKVFAIEAGKYESEISTQKFVMAVAGSNEAEESVTLSFASTEQRTEYSTSKQVWEQNGITLTNNKGGSSTPVADYAAPARFYKSSEIIVEFTSPIAKIEFTCNTTEYATNLKSSISGASVSGKIVTVQLDGTSSIFTIDVLSGGQVRMDALTVTPVAEASVEDYYLNVTAAGWATLYLDYNVVIPEDVTCYVISEIGEEAVQLEEVTGVLPAETAVIVEAAEGEYAFEVSLEDAGKIESNMLGTTKNEYIDKEAYVLGIVDGEVGLYKAEMKGGVWLNNAYKAYLPMPAASGVSFYGFRFDEEENTTGIEVVENANENVIYDLAGRRVSEITEKGIYIIDGKKVLVK